MRRRIAIVEDDPVLRANYAEALQRHGFEVSAYPARDEALAAMRNRLPDLALIDIGLGGDVDGGFALCRELRALSAALPIIFLTARDSDFDIVRQGNSPTEGDLGKTPRTDTVARHGACLAARIVAGCGPTGEVQSREWSYFIY